MLVYVVKRMLGIVPVLIGVSIIVFLSVRLIPGDPAVAVGGIHATVEDLARIRHRLGLDRPVHYQYFFWVRSVLGGDLGRSVANDYPVLPQLVQRSMMTLQLSVTALVLTVVVGVPLGVVAAYHPHRSTDYAAMSLAMVGVSMPVFWLGLLLIYVFAVRWHVFPVSGAGTVSHLALPSLTLALYSVALVSRMTRASMLEVLSRDYIRTAHAKGCAASRVLTQHGLRNALIPVITVAGLQFGYLLSGAVVTETVFAWPGLGRLMADAVFLRDFPIIQGGVLLVAVAFVLVNLLTDVLVAFSDPRVRYD